MNKNESANESLHEDHFDITGTVTMVRVDKPVFAFKHNGNELEAIYQPRNKNEILTALSKPDTTRVRIQGRGLITKSGQLTHISTIEKLTASPIEESLPEQTNRPIWEVIHEIMSDLPPEELATIPTDLSEEHDHYIYGLPKKKAE